MWTPGKGSPIHDHGNAHCLMKILKGEITETRYDFPDGDKAQPMRVKQEQVYKANQTAYMADELGLHRVSNQGSDFAVSLHCRSCGYHPFSSPHATWLTSSPVYTPPNVAKHGCHIFNSSTGEKKHIPNCGYHSVYGQVVEKHEDASRVIRATA